MVVVLFAMIVCNMKAYDNVGRSAQRWENWELFLLYRVLYMYVIFTFLSTIYGNCKFILKIFKVHEDCKYVNNIKIIHQWKSM